MIKSLRVENASTGKRLLSVLFDVLSLAVLSIALFFTFLYAVMNPINKYTYHKNYSRQIEDEYGLNLKSGLTYDNYEKVLQHFYLVDCPEEIKAEVNKNYGTNYSITHIYNVVVLLLPDQPTIENYQNDYFSYKIDADGNFLVDELAVLVEGHSGPVYEKNMRDLFYNSYIKLKEMLASYRSDYGFSVLMIQTSELVSRIVSISLAFTVLYIIIPLINKNGATLFEKLYHIGHVNYSSGYSMPKYKIVLSALINYSLPILGFVIFTKYSIVLISILYFFLNNLVMVLNGDNRNISELILRTLSINIDNSLVFKNRKEEKEYENSDENKVVTEQEFLDKLEATKSVKNSEQ